MKNQIKVYLFLLILSLSIGIVSAGTYITAEEITTNNLNISENIYLESNLYTDQEIIFKGEYDVYNRGLKFEQDSTSRRGSYINFDRIDTFSIGTQPSAGKTPFYTPVLNMNVSHPFVGIGVLNPLAKLHILNTHNDGDFYGLGNISTLIIEDELDDATPFVIDHNGDIDLGASVELYDSSYATYWTFLNASQLYMERYDGQDVFLSMYFDDGKTSSSFMSGIDNADGFYKISRDDFSKTDLVIDLSGNVGIGYNAPAEKLHVSGNMKFENNEGWIYTGNGGGLYWNSTHTCIVGPDGNPENGNCDTN